MITLPPPPLFKYAKNRLKRCTYTRQIDKEYEYFGLCWVVVMHIGPNSI